MSIEEAKKFFAIVLDLKYNRKKDQITFRRIIRIMDPNNTKTIPRSVVVDYFSIPGFLQVKRLAKLQLEAE